MAILRTTVRQTLAVALALVRLEVTAVELWEVTADHPYQIVLAVRPRITAVAVEVALTQVAVERLAVLVVVLVRVMGHHITPRLLLRLQYQIVDLVAVALLTKAKAEAVQVE